MQQSSEEKREYYPLTHAQKRVYYDDILFPGSPWANLGFLVTYEEELDFNLISEAINKVVMKNDALRLRLVEFDYAPEPKQYISPYSEVHMDYIDLAGPNPDQRVKEWIEKITSKPFHLIDSDLFYCAYIKFSQQSSGYYLKLHHTICDGWTSSLLFTEINDIYRALKGGQVIDNTPNPSYIRYIKEETDYLQSEDFKKDKEFWHNTLLPLPEVVDLSTQKGYPTNIKAQRITLAFPDNLRAMMHEYCRTHKTSLYKLVLSALSIYISGMTGSNDIVIGGASHGRSKKEYGYMMGMFVSTFVSRIKIEMDKTFEEHVKINGNNLNYIVKNHSRYPFDVLATELREITGSEVGYLRNITLIGHSDVEKKSFDYKYIFPGFEPGALLIHLNVENRDKEGILEMEWVFQVEKFSSGDIQRFHHGLSNVLKNALISKGKKISEIQFLSNEEKEQILYDFNDMETEYPKGKALYELFEAQVENTPDNVSIVFRDKSLTYRALNERSNQLARLVKELGIGPDSIVPLIVERSLEMMIGIFAILKAGGAYLPIDPFYPRERIYFMVKDSRSKLLLSQIKYDILIEVDAESINIDSYEKFHQNETTNLLPINSPRDLAYIIYTSGSTGQPKGVLIEHISAVNTLWALSRKYPLTASDIYLLKTAFLFDVSVSEIFGWFWLGARLTILEPGAEKDPQNILDVIEMEKITHINFVPSLFNLFVNILDSSNITKLTGLKYIFLAGEAIWPESITKFRALGSQVVIENLYGPTEATIYASGYSVAGWNGKGSIPIGIPLDNLKLFISGYDESNLTTLRPLGVPGELGISGIGLSRGYMNRPALTSEKFVENPFTQPEWDSSYKRLYRTGDLTQWTPGGIIDYLGRIDHQVKIRGFRIETGEIESKILNQRDQVIREAVVIDREDYEGEKYLCAYISSDNNIDIAKLQNSISRDLPDYMVPTYFVKLNAIPLTPNGKVNRKALPAPKVIEQAKDFVPPRNEIEKKLAEIWADILHMKKELLGIDDNFFKLGGHSLKAAVMITKIHKIMNTRIMMNQIFNLPTIRKLAAYIKEAKQELYSSIETVEEKEYYPQTSAQKRLYFIDRIEEQSILYNMQLMDIYCKGIAKENLMEAFKKLFKRHLSLRTSFCTIEGEAVQRIHRYEDIISRFTIEYWETAEKDGMIYSEEPGKEWTKVTGLPFHDLIEHFVKPFDLSLPPLVRVGLIKIWGQTQILMLDIHHIISDGISMILLIKELWELFDGAELPALRIQYKDFSKWSHHENQQQVINKQENFWLKEFRGEIPILNLPYDYPRPARMTFSGHMVHFEIGEEETGRLNALVQKQGKTLYMILFAAYYVLLAKLSGQEEIVVGTVSAGRNHDDIQPLIGMFVETMAIRNYPKGEKTFNNFLAEVKEKTILAFENQNYPFDQLVSKVSARQDRSRNPLFDVVFTLDNEAERTDEYLLNVLMLDRTNPYMLKRAKFDITLMGAETEDGLQFNLEYNTQLFKEKTIERFIIYFNKIISSICRNVELKIADIEILPDLERGLLLYAFNDTESEYPKSKNFIELFEEQVDKNPKNTAVVGISLMAESGSPKVASDQTLTYSLLNEKVNQLASQLRYRGLGREYIAAIMIEPSQEMIIGLLAILKVGGAFLPIDHKIPRDRKEYILKESATMFLLTSKNLAREISFAGEILQIDNEELNKGEKSNPVKVNSCDDLAYIIYTSGSTGKPKGVMVQHRSLINLCFWHNIYYLVTSRDRATKYAGFGFDASIWEIFPYLSIGAALYVVPEDIKLDIQKLNRYFESNGISISFLPTQLCEQFMTLENKSLRVLLTGGDKLKSFIKKKYHLYNNYGPTENTVVTTSYLVTKLINNIPIGKPLFNSRIYVLDKHFHLQPIGVPGELCIGGDSLARGYLNNPVLTMEKFTPNPYSPPPMFRLNGDVLYRTGDLARWLQDGNIEFLGRSDYQVKIRGFRIELGEIENQLLHIENIKEAVVIAREDSPGTKNLCAYIVAKVEKEIDVPLVRRILSKNLPEYMIPSFFLAIEKMPLNPSGKIDTKALPAPEVKGVEYAAPTNETEILVAQIWQEILGLEKISIDDNFFEIGGDSIKTIRISGKLQKQGFMVNVNDFFLNPTIRKLARRINEKRELPTPEAERRDRELLEAKINNDYEIYREQVKNEKWPDLSIENRYQHIMLTGATGYLGAYLLFELLEHTSATLYLLIRGNSEKEAEERLKHKMAYYFGSDLCAAYKQRIIILPGNLREDRLGINSTRYETLSNTVEVVIHSAANVRHYGLFKELFKDNVEGTEHLLRFALAGKKKDFHFISTIDVGRGNIPGRDQILFTEYCHDEGQQSDHIYIKSKFTAEKKILSYRDKGINASIYRAGNVTFCSETGGFQENIENNAFYAIMKGIIKVGLLSENMLRLKFDMSFVNYTARAVVALLKKSNLKNQTYHISNPNKLPIEEMLEFLKKMGINVRDCHETKQFLGKVDGMKEYEEIIERVKLDSWAWEEIPGTITVPKEDRTVVLLEKLGFTWPNVIREHIEKMISHCKKVGFF